MAEAVELFSGNLLEALSRLRDVHPDMTILQTLCLLAVGNNPGITQREVMDRVGTNDSVASRTFAILADIGNRNTAALNLVEMRFDKDDRRVRRLYLTARGQRLLADIRKDLGGRH